MSEIIGNRKIYSLREMTLSIQKGVEDRYAKTYWIKAEMNKLNATPGSGHCFPELVEKKDGKVISQMRAYLWRGDYERVNSAFLEVLKEPLRDGIKIFFEAKVTFHPVYGLALWIKDIDPTFTLGDLEQEKQATIARLKAAGLYGLNQRLTLPMLPQRIAIISVQNSNGYADFIEILEGNAWGYKFFHMLFPASLQGDRVVADMTRQLNRIEKIAHHFDAVAIIRGGGGDVGLSCYNDYRLASVICAFPLPVLTGIGHSTNMTVCEMVANRRAITPTKMGELLIEKFHAFSQPVTEAGNKIARFSTYGLQAEEAAVRHAMLLFKSNSLSRVLHSSHQLQSLSRRLAAETRFHLSRSHKNVQQLSSGVRSDSAVVVRTKSEQLTLAAATCSRESFRRSTFELDQLKLVEKGLKSHTKQFLSSTGKEVALLESQAQAMDPAEVLRRGYSLTMTGGKVIQDLNQLKKGTKIITRLYTGDIESIIDHIQKNKKNESTG